MSEENVEVVRRSFEANNAFMRGDLSGEAFAQLFDPQIQLHWHDQRTYPDTPQHLQGVSEVMAFIEKFRDDWIDVVQEPLELIEAPEGRVFGFTHQSGRGRRSGVPIDIHFFEVWAIRDGRVRRLEYFRHRGEALEAAGLSE
jgi:ketosteroid isomerase-like protein